MSASISSIALVSVLSRETEGASLGVCRQTHNKAPCVRFNWRSSRSVTINTHRGNKTTYLLLRVSENLHKAYKCSSPSLQIKYITSRSAVLTFHCVFSVILSRASELRLFPSAHGQSLSPRASAVTVSALISVHSVVRTASTAHTSCWTASVCEWRGSDAAVLTGLALNTHTHTLYFLKSSQ